MRNIFHRLINGQLNRISRVQHGSPRGQEREREGESNISSCKYNMAGHIQFCFQVRLPSPPPSPIRLPPSAVFGVFFMWVNVSMAKTCLPSPCLSNCLLPLPVSPSIAKNKNIKKHKHAIETRSDAGHHNGTNVREVRDCDNVYDLSR